MKWETSGTTAGVLGYLDYGTTDGVLLSAVPAQATAYSDLFFSQLAESAGYYTGLAFLNPNSQTSMLNIEAFAAYGKSLGKTAISLAAGERRSRLVREFIPGLGNPLGGYVRVSATLPVFAFELFGSSASLSFLANVPAQGTELIPHASGFPVSAATGARVLSEDRTSEVAITPGALSSDLEIIIRTPLVAPPPPSANDVLVASVEALPPGTRFNVPVRIAVALSAQLPAGLEIPLLIYDSTTRQYENSGFTAVVDETGRTAVAWVTHFTIYGLPVDALRLLKIDSITTSSGPTGTTLLIKGSGFSAAENDNVVTFAGNNETVRAIPTNVTSTAMNVVVPAGAVNGFVTLLSGGKSAQGLYFMVVNPRPKPMLSSVSPNSADSQATFVELRLPGTGFHPASVVRMNGSPLATSTYVNPELMLATLGRDKLVPGVHKMTVFTPEPGGGESEVREFTVGYSKPTIASISPSSATDGAAAVTATITGTGFTAASTVIADGAQRTATFISATQMQVVLQSLSPVTLQIMVSNPSPGGGLSNSVMFTFLRRAVASIALISQSATSGVVATSVSFTVELRDSSGTPYSGQRALFSISSGNGSVTPISPTSDNGSVTRPSTTSDGQGRIAAALTLGTVAGQNQVTVSADSVTLSVQAQGTPGPFTQLAKISGDAQTANNGAPLTDPLVVEARDQFNNAIVSGVSVTFSVTSGGGSVSPAAAQTTGSNGRTQATATLGVPVATHVFRATSGSVTADFTATATQSAATSLTQTSTNSAGTVNTTQTFTVQTTDVRSNPVPGVTVTFAVTSGNGSVSASSATTGSDGKASTTITLSQTAGGNTFTASASGVTTITLALTGNAGSAASLAIAAGNNQTGQAGSALSTALKVQAKDTFSNVVSGVSVTFSVVSGGGSVSPSTAQTTDSNGFASVTATAGGSVGTQTFRATAGTLTADFNATISAGAVTQLAKISGDSQTGNTSAQLTDPLVVEARDQFGNAVSGASVTFTVTSGNGSVSPSTAQTTGSNGRVQVTATLGSSGATHTFQAATGSITASFTATADVTAPTVSSTNIAETSLGDTSISLSWAKATDDVTAQASLVYKVYMSAANPSNGSFGTVAAVEAGTLVGTSTDISSITISSGPNRRLVRHGQRRRRNHVRRILRFVKQSLQRLVLPGKLRFRHRRQRDGELGTLGSHL